MKRAAVGAITVGALVVGLGAVQLLPDGSTPLAPRPAVAAGLVPYDGCASLLQDYRDELVRTATPYGWGGFATAFSGGGSARTTMPAAATADSAENAAAVGNGATGTNVQEQGVDEPDVVKLGDGHLVTVARGALRVISTDDQPRELGRLALPGEQAQYLSGLELLLSGDRALVVQQGYRQQQPSGRAVASAYGGDSPTTTLRLADLSDPSSPRWLESYEISGSYLSARLVDGTVRLVTRSTPVPQPVELDGQVPEARRLAAQRAAARTMPLSRVLPQASRLDGDGNVLRLGSAVECGDVSSARDAAGGGLLLVTTLRPSLGLAPVDSTGVRADGELVYATADRLVVATSRWGTEASPFADLAPRGDDVSTQLHSFDTADPSALRYVGTGSVGGYVLGRWALSWHEGALRVATTTGQPWGPEAARSQSSLVALRETDGALTEVGRVDGLGKGEKIQAVRYLGDLATVVTFRQTDPLYVLDLADPAAPRVRGELKVPGFSTYLHPIGDDRLLGIGMEADVTSGRTTGMQASVFDLSDLSRPRQVDRLQLGNGYSAALQESRAFGYDPQRRTAVLPYATGDDAYGLGLRVAQDGTLSEAGRVDVSGAPQTYVDVQRVVLDGARVHVLTSDAVVTARAADLTRTGSLALR